MKLVWCGCRRRKIGDVLDDQGWAVMGGKARIINGARIGKHLERSIHRRTYRHNIDGRFAVVRSVVLADAGMIGGRVGNIVEGGETEQHAQDPDQGVHEAVACL